MMGDRRRQTATDSSAATQSTGQKKRHQLQPHVLLLCFLVFPLPIVNGSRLLFNSTPALAQTTQDRKAEADRLFEQGTKQLEQSQNQLAVPARKQISPFLELCGLRLSANVSYERTEADLRLLTGMVVSHSTQQRRVQATAFATPEVTPDAPLAEAAIDGGKVRLSTPKGEASVWRDYKAIATNQGIVANFRNNQALIAWVKHQPQGKPLICLGDGHEGIWKIVRELAPASHRLEMLDWFHLKENLYKVGGSFQRLKAAKTLLWSGKVEAVIALFKGWQDKQVENFCQYLRHHQHRIINYDYYQSEGICSVGSGQVESAIKQIDRRLKISGAQWKAENVPQVLAHRTAYLNAILS